MKINLSLTKKKDGKVNGGLQEIKKKQIEKVFSTSDDEEAFTFESSQNKKIEEKEKQRIEKEIKDFIHEHECVSEENRRRKENKEREEKKKNDRKKIVYLGYKGKELTNFKREKEEGFSENESSDERCSQSSSSVERKKDRRKRERKQRELQNAEREKEKTYKNKSYLHNQKKEKRRGTQCNDPVPCESFVDPRRKEVNVDEIFMKTEEKKNMEEHKKEEKPKSQYINALINSAKRKKIEKEMLIQKKLKVDSEKKEKVFITSAYKKIMMDRELIKQEILKEEEEKEKEKKDGQRNFNLSAFYKNINAPSNYDRMNRRNYPYDQSRESDY